MDGSTSPDGELWRQLYAYWRALLADGSPLDADPAQDMPAFAANMMIVDIIDDGFRYRHFGSEIAGRLNADLTGKSAGESDLVEPLKLGWHQLLRSVARLRKPRLIQITGEADTKNYLLVMPLAEAGKPVRRLLAGVFFDPRSGPRIIIRGWRKIIIEDGSRSNAA